MPKFKGPLEELLYYYDPLVKEMVEKRNGVFQIILKLDENFLKICRERIIKGNLQYGDDWKTKDNLKELDEEKYDIWNYLALHACQKKYRNKS